MADSKAERYGLMTFTGPAGRTYFDKDGVLQTAGENEIREEYDSLTGEYLGTLIEPPIRTNHLPYSDNFRKWRVLTSGGSVSLIDASAASPDGGNNAQRYRFEINGSSGYALIQETFSSIEKLKFSVFIRFVSGNTNKIITYRDGFLEGDMPFEIENTWNRYEKTFQKIDNNLKIGLITNLGSKNNDWVEIDVWAAQIERGENATSYIPTNGSPVTLRGEDARLTDLALFSNLERGALYIEFEAISDGELLSTDGGIFIGVTGETIYVDDGVTRSEHALAIGVNRFAISWDGETRTESANGNDPVTYDCAGWGSGDLYLCRTAGAYISPNDYLNYEQTAASGNELQRWTAGV
tara:strand:- start:3018 stop:4073 length:1056 start_codon:yes stop_codon:yes gene_type:complete